MMGSFLCFEILVVFSTSNTVLFCAVVYGVYNIAAEKENDRSRIRWHGYHKRLCHGAR